MDKMFFEVYSEMMLVRRWIAPLKPNLRQIQALFEREGLSAFEERYAAGAFVPPHRHPFDEVRMIVQGRLLYDISGNKLLLREGDRITIPSNTLHSKKIQGKEPCLSICAYQT